MIDVNFGYSFCRKTSGCVGEIKSFANSPNNVIIAKTAETGGSVLKKTTAANHV
jgi:hypothetical protein